MTSASAPSTERTSTERTLRELRDEIEQLDETIIATIARRTMLAREAGRVKVASGQPITDPAREAAVVSRASVLARAAGLPDDEIRALYWQLMALSRRVQMER